MPILGVPSITVRHRPQPAGTPTTTITNVDAVQFMQGRRNITDLFGSGGGTVEGRRPDLLPSMKIGDTIEITINNGVFAKTANFRLGDLSVTYGFRDTLDRWQITVEDSFAYLGRGTVTTTVVGGDKVSVTASTCCSQNGITFSQTGTTTAFSSAQTITAENALDVFQTCLNTEQARVWADGVTINWWARTAWQAALNTVTFSDDGTGTYTYDELEFTTMADNYSDKVVVVPRGSSSVVTGTGVFAYNLDSYSLNTTEAQNLGNYLLGSLDVRTSRIKTLRYFVNSQNVTDGFAPTAAYPTRVGVKFRGSTYYGMVEGYQYAASLGAAYITLFLSPDQNFQYLVLNDATFGKLDENKLGW